MRLCDIRNNQGRGKCYQPSRMPRLITLTETLISIRGCLAPKKSLILRQASARTSDFLLVLSSKLCCNTHFYPSGLTCFLCMAVGLLFCQRSGEYWLQMFDSFTGTLPLLFICFFELIGVSWVYGANRWETRQQ